MTKDRLHRTHSETGWTELTIHHYKEYKVVRFVFMNDSSVVLLSTLTARDDTEVVQVSLPNLFALISMLKHEKYNRLWNGVQITPRLFIPFRLFTHQMTLLRGTPLMSRGLISKGLCENVAETGMKCAYASFTANVVIYKIKSMQKRLLNDLARGMRHKGVFLGPRRIHFPV